MVDFPPDSSPIVLEMDEARVCERLATAYKAALERGVIVLAVPPMPAMKLPPDPTPPLHVIDSMAFIRSEEMAFKPKHLEKAEKKRKNKKDRPAWRR